MTNTAIGSENLSQIDNESFKALSKEDQERVLGIGVRQLWKALHSASVHNNAECIGLATVALEGTDSLATQFCRLSRVYRTGNRTPVLSEKDFLGWVARKLFGHWPHESHLRREVFGCLKELE